MPLQRLTLELTFKIEAVGSWTPETQAFLVGGPYPGPETAPRCINKMTDPRLDRVEESGTRDLATVDDVAPLATRLQCLLQKSRLFTFRNAHQDLALKREARSAQARRTIDSRETPHRETGFPAHLQLLHVASGCIGRVGGVL